MSHLAPIAVLNTPGRRDGSSVLPLQVSSLWAVRSGVWLRRPKQRQCTRLGSPTQLQGSSYPDHGGGAVVQRERYVHHVIFPSAKRPEACSSLQRLQVGDHRSLGKPWGIVGDFNQVNKHKNRCNDFDMPMAMYLFKLFHKIDILQMYSSSLAKLELWPSSSLAKLMSLLVKTFFSGTGCSQQLRIPINNSVILWGGVVPLRLTYLVAVGKTLLFTGVPLAVSGLCFLVLQGNTTSSLTILCRPASYTHLKISESVY